MPPVFVGILLNSALYLGSCVVAGLVSGYPVAWRLAVAAMGVTYLGYMGQIIEAVPPKVQYAVVAASVVIGAAAGVALLFGW